MSVLPLAPLLFKRTEYITINYHPLCLLIMLIMYFVPKRWKIGQNLILSLPTGWIFLNLCAKVTLALNNIGMLNKNVHVIRLKIVELLNVHHLGHLNISIWANGNMPYCCTLAIMWHVWVKVYLSFFFIFVWLNKQFSVNSGYYESESWRCIIICWFIFISTAKLCKYLNGMLVCQKLLVISWLSLFFLGH